ncbi:MAG TPA: hypothetical protein VHZ73_03490, partial [Vicinamibacterales bacterium]|nr:hypothetical protein [Vicinamibacterales bacterium]
TMQKFNEAMITLAGAGEQSERLGRAAWILKEARERGVGVGFDDRDHEEEFTRALDSTLDVATRVELITSLACNALRAQIEHEHTSLNVSVLA